MEDYFDFSDLMPEDINSVDPLPDEELPWVDPAWDDIFDSYELYREQVLA